MRMLMTADAVGGVWTYANDLAHALDAEVTIATMGPPPAERGEGVVVSTYALEWEDDPWDDVDRAGAWLLELEEELEPDVVHLNGYAHGALPWRAPLVVAAHSDVVSWWWAVHGRPPPQRYDRYRSAVEVGLRAADAVVAPTSAVLDDLRRHYRLRREPVVVPNGSSFDPASAAKEPFVLGLGRFRDEGKNLVALERACATLPWPLVAAGEGTALGRLGRAEVRSLLARAAVFASPARYEPFGLGILEAARSGCALVLGDIPSLREVWGEAALFAPPEDDEALAAALGLVTCDSELRAELAVRARRRATRYTVDAMAAGYARVYDHVLSAVAA
ncbi:MAG TPA: glycosyltransferase family 4 protein [Gaiellaceae bacterium]|nr:glycosyltransferase family 4 protein [Gaiellaceae bacterium]